MNRDKQLFVFYKDRKVGMLAQTVDRKIAFAYDDAWLEEGFSISPFSLPLKKQVFIAQKNYFQGLYGVFADSLPDAWGNILLNRMLRAKNITDGALSILDRLAIVGNSGMGALSYRPSIPVPSEVKGVNLDHLAQQCVKILNTEYAEDLDLLYRLGGTSGGARPKILTNIDGEEWMIKFPAHVDGRNAGRVEYDYSVCARRCGIVMTETRLFPSKNCQGYFGTRRFDRRCGGDGKTEKVHMLTAAALLEIDFEQPCLDYHSLMKLTKILTRNNADDVENMFRRMCFNVFAHNRDDHAKNFSFLYEEKTDSWRLAPAYDLTYSSTYYGEHTTSVDGNGANPGRKELLAVGRGAGMKKAYCERVIDEIEQCVGDMLRAYL